MSMHMLSTNIQALYREPEPRRQSSGGMRNLVLAPQTAEFAAKASPSRSPWH